MHDSLGLIDGPTLDLEKDYKSRGRLIRSSI